MTHRLSRTLLPARGDGPSTPRGHRGRIIAQVSPIQSLMMTPSGSQEFSMAVGTLQSAALRPSLFVFGSGVLLSPNKG